jgi:glycosyltransferase involved in cell wall biosynthesis
MPQYNFIYMALARWDGPYASTAWAIAQALAKQHHVFYIENPFTIKDAIFGLKEKRMRQRIPALLFGKKKFTSPFPALNLVVITPLAILPINWLPKGPIYNLLNKLNSYLVYRSIKSTLNTYKLANYISFNSFNPFYGIDFPKSFQPKLIIYQSVDAIEQSDYIKKHGPEWEERYVRKADFSVTTSTQLRKKLAVINPDVHLIPNAAEITLFKTAREKVLEKPHELKKLAEDQPIIGYIGNICHRLDYDLLIKLATIYSNYHLVMVGPQKAQHEKVEKLKAMDNVIFTGSKPLKELPNYLQYFTVGIIPFLCNELTTSIYPLKINEYLASGTPVVSTSFSVDIQDFKQVIQLATSADEFIENIAVAAIQKNKEWDKESLSFVAANNWDNRAQQLVELINEKSNEQKKRK